jgi:hypothetical protein
MRPRFLPDGSLLLGQTGRGWGARGGRVASLQRVVYDGETVAADILKVTAAKRGFTIHFTRPLAPGVTGEKFAGAVTAASWFYTNTSQYGSPEHDRRDETPADVMLADDRMSAQVALEHFGEGEGWTDRIYHLKIPDTGELFGDAPVRDSLEAYYTVRAIPSE